ncbi:hypothetical protein TFLX_05805 [Thermoflexales bacterium]|nr:hypothetical protein TFLX_05805 [Thermoflexales bacterium]
MLYPNRPGSTFEMNYYLNTHMPMSIERLSAQQGYRGISVERGLAGDAPGTAPAYVAMCHYLFDSMEEFLAAFTPHAALLQGDMPNYTDITPVIQVSEVEIVN